MRPPPAKISFLSKITARHAQTFLTKTAHPIVIETKISSFFVKKIKKMMIIFLISGSLRAVIRFVQRAFQPIKRAKNNDFIQTLSFIIL